MTLRQYLVCRECRKVKQHCRWRVDKPTNSSKETGRNKFSSYVLRSFIHLQNYNVSLFLFNFICQCELNDVHTYIQLSNECKQTLKHFTGVCIISDRITVSVTIEFELFKISRMPEVLLRGNSKNVYISLSLNPKIFVHTVSSTVICFKDIRQDFTYSFFMNISISSSSSG
jgi:hypothetical protein